MPSLPDALEAYKNQQFQLERAFNEIVAQTKKEYPDFWTKALEIFDGNEKHLSHWLLTERIELDNKRGFNLLSENAENVQSVLDALTKYEHGFTCA